MPEWELKASKKEGFGDVPPLLGRLAHFMHRQLWKFSAPLVEALGRVEFGAAVGAGLSRRDKFYHLEAAHRLPMRVTGAFICGVHMPTYEYSCEKCDHQFDVFQSIKDKPLTVCPEEKCRLKKWGKGKVKKMIGSGAGLIFKGSGFYITDYRSDSYKEAAKKDAAPSGDSGSKAKEAGSKSEAKPKETKTSKPDKS
jgi:putative FmdB family regulatory protein